jgi:hypothetical protein
MGRSHDAAQAEEVFFGLSGSHDAIPKIAT